MIPIFNTDALSKVVNNIVGYGRGFVSAIEANKLAFNAKVAAACVATLYEYIDAKAGVNPESLHHVYEPGMVGMADGRLFEFDFTVALDLITITGKFKESQIPPLGGGHVFTNRAEVMEAGVSITIAPKDSEVLAFMDDGELVFTSSSVTVEHPGGEFVERSFGDTVYSFFAVFATKGVIDPIMRKMASPIEFSQNFDSGAKHGTSAGLRAGQKYMESSFNELI